MKEHPEPTGKTKIKICGLTKMEDITYVNSSSPDYIGFVFAQKSRRLVSFDQAAQLRKQLKPSIQAVGVFVDEAPEVIAELFSRHIIEIAQLHGSEDENYIKKLRWLTNVPLIQAFRISTTEDLIKAQESKADYLLLDAANAGSGIPFDWSLIGEMERPYFLAGGLHAENIQEALERFHPYGVDVSSGVETDGSKDNKKIEQFAQLVRNFDYSAKSLYPPHACMKVEH